MRRPWTLCLLASLAVGCRDLPTELPSSERSAPPPLAAANVPVSVAPSLTCTRIWIGGFSSEWNDPGRWSPVGVPRPSDVVCILTDRLPDVHDSVRVRGLEIGPHAAADFHENFVQVLDTIVVHGELDIDSPTDLSFGALINFGEVEIDNATAVGDLVNHGELELGKFDRVLWSGDRVVNHPTGSVTTALSDPSAFTADVVEWSGPGTAVRLRAGALFLPAPGAPYALTLERADTIYGDIGPHSVLYLGVQGVTGQQYRFRKSRTNPGGTVVNRGELHIEDAQRRPVLLDFPAVFEQRGELTLLSPATVTAGRLLNRGLIYSFAGDLDVESGIVNEAEVLVIDSTLRTLAGSTFEARSGSTMSGNLTLVSATLSGSGRLGSVLAINTVIAPGTANAPLGQLDFYALELDALSRLDLEVADTTAGSFDRLVVADTVHLFGDVRVTTAAGFQGGLCGQVVPLITGEVGGQFQTVTLPAAGSQRAWRLHVGASGVDLVGFRPGGPFALDAGALTLEEGGPAMSYRMCLGPTAPTAPVQIMPRSRVGELSVGSAVTFDPADWMLPRTVSLIAVDDAEVEGTHADTLAHMVTTTDPTYVAAARPRLPVTILDNDVAADLTLVKVSQEDNQFLGDTMSTTFRVTNAGPSPATDVRVTSLPLVGLELVDATGATCALAGGGELDCALGHLDPGVQTELVIRFRGAAVGLHTNTLSVASAETDPAPGDNTVVYTQRVN